MYHSILFASRGISVVEVVVAIAIFSVVSMVGYQVFIQSNTILERKEREQKALWLAQEGIEASRAIAHNDFSDMSEGSWGLSSGSDTWQFSGSEDVTDQFARTVTISDIDQDTKTIRSRVSWVYNSEEDSVSLFTEVTDWNKVVEVAQGALIIDTSQAQISGKRLRRLYLSTESNTPIIIDTVEVLWTKGGRVLEQIQSPGGANNAVWSGAAISGDVLSVSDLIVTNTSNNEIRFIFDKNMNNSDFTITFTMSDGTTETVTLTDL